MEVKLVLCQHSIALFKIHVFQSLTTSSIDLKGNLICAQIQYESIDIV